MWEDIPELRQKIKRGAALLDQQKVVSDWIDRIDIDKLGFWRDSFTPLEQIFGDEHIGREIILGPEYYGNISGEKALELENCGFILYLSPFTMWQLAREWITYITERREQDERSSIYDTASSSK